MKTLIPALCLAAALQGCTATNHLDCPQAAAAHLTLVSDVDDTVKVTNVMSTFARVKNGLWGKLMFAGMPDLYKELLAGEASGRLEFVSAAPKFLSKRVTRGLCDAGFDGFHLALRANLMKAPEQFKVECLGGMHGKSENPGGRFYLIGDDTEKDPEVYAKFRAERKCAVIATYIHRITGRDFDYENNYMTVFTTAYDIALNEYREHRLSPEQAEIVGQAVLTSPDPAFLPVFQECADGSTPRGDLPEPLKVLNELIEKRMRSLCSEPARQNGRSKDVPGEPSEGKMSWGPDPGTPPKKTAETKTFVSRTILTERRGLSRRHASRPLASSEPSVLRPELHAGGRRIPTSPVAQSS